MFPSLYPTGTEIPGQVRTIEAADAEEALRVTGDVGTPIDLIVTDVIMPGISGVDLMTRLAQIHPGIKSLFMSGYPDYAGPHGLPNAAALLQKPFSPEGLAEKVRSNLRQPQTV